MVRMESSVLFFHKGEGPSKEEGSIPERRHGDRRSPL